MRRMLASALRNICSRWNATGGIGIILSLIGGLAWIVSPSRVLLPPWVLLSGIALFLAGFGLKVMLDFVVPLLEGDGEEV